MAETEGLLAAAPASFAAAARRLVEPYLSMFEGFESLGTSIGKQRLMGTRFE
jgi:hypothetical protein